MRVIAREGSGVENNLSLANMYFEEFVCAVEDDGVRGFRDAGVRGAEQRTILWFLADR